MTPSAEVKTRSEMRSAKGTDMEMVQTHLCKDTNQPINQPTICYVCSVAK